MRLDELWMVVLGVPLGNSYGFGDRHLRHGELPFHKNRGTAIRAIEAGVHPSIADDGLFCGWRQRTALRKLDDLSLRGYEGSHFK